MAGRRKGSRSSGPIGCALVVIVTMALLAWLVGRLFSSEPIVVPLLEQCTATSGDLVSSLTLEQSGNAAIIAGEAERRGLPARAATIALATAWQESGLRNLDYGDRDSLGLFQQRPSQGWGTEQQIMDPWYSAGKFYETLVKVPDWQNGDINDVAQMVQRSGVPEGYRKHEANARVWASALFGHSPAAGTCIDRTETPGDVTALQNYYNKVFGRKLDVRVDGTTVTLRAGDTTTVWAATQLGLASTQSAGIVTVQLGGQTWVRDPLRLATWQGAPGNAATEAVLTLRG